MSFFLHGYKISARILLPSKEERRKLSNLSGLESCPQASTKRDIRKLFIDAETVGIPFSDKHGTPAKL